MKISFLGQGLEVSSANAVGYSLMKYLECSDFHSFTGISAFASEAGIIGLSGYIQRAKKKFKNITLIVGIDQQGTSKEALLEIFSLNIDSYIFYQTEAPIFHPKIYLFEGDSCSKIIIGSSNLTGKGLFTNVESSILIEFDEDEKDGSDLLNEIKSYYRALFDFSDPNIFKINEELISIFSEDGTIPSEATRRQFYNEKKLNRDSANTNILKNLTNIPKRPTARLPKAFPTKRRKPVSDFVEVNKEANISQNVILIDEIIQDAMLLWKSNPLTQRDLNIPKGENTNATGSMLFKKGQLEGIDQRHYFRDKIFSSLPWAYDAKAGSTHFERATAFFHLIIQGTYHGRFPLILTHNTKTDTKTYLQNNSMTWISWGGAKHIIANDKLLTKIASLYKNVVGENNEYIFTID